MTIDGGRPTGSLVAARRSADAAGRSWPSDDGWWFQQDRVTLVRGERALAPGAHDVAVSSACVIPYLQVGPGRPARPCRSTPSSRWCWMRRHVRGSTQPRPDADRGGRRRSGAARGLGARASAFNWTPEMIARRPGCRRHRGRASSRTASPRRSKSEPGTAVALLPGARAKRMSTIFGDRLTAAGGRVSIVGASMDDWLAAGHPRARRRAVRVPPAPDRDRAPLGARGRAAADRPGGPNRCSSALLPILHETGLDAVRRDPGSQTPGSPRARRARSTRSSSIDDPHVRLLRGHQMFMPSLSPRAISRVLRGGRCAGGAHRRAAGPVARPGHRGRRRSTLLRSGGVPGIRAHRCTWTCSCGSGDRMRP